LTFGRTAVALEREHTEDVTGADEDVPMLCRTIVALGLVALSCAPTTSGAGRLSGSDGSSPAVPPLAASARVVGVTDGDTVVLRGIDVGEVDVRTGGRRSRLIGIDTPEVRPGAECYGHQASAFTRRELEGETVSVAFDVERIDRYGRALVYVWHDGEMFNARLAERGYAQQLTIPPNVRYADLFRRLVREAREGKRGLWRDC
jgi:micrococcal nuclease